MTRLLAAFSLALALLASPLSAAHRRVLRSGIPARRGRRWLGLSYRLSDPRGSQSRLGLSGVGNAHGGRTDDASRRRRTPMGKRSLVAVLGRNRDRFHLRHRWAARVLSF